MPGKTSVAPTAARYPENLFTYLGDKYTLDVHEGLTVVCPSRLCARAPGGGIPAVSDLPPTNCGPSGSSAERGAAILFDVVADGDDRAQRLARFADRDGALPGPRLDYLHSLLPHSPWQYLPSGKAHDVRPNDGLAAFFFGWADAEAARVARISHLLQLKYTDGQLLRLLDQLQASGRFDETLIVVTVDHGVAFDGGQHVRGITSVNEVDIGVDPAVHEGAGSALGPGADDRNADTIDVLPTVADMIGIDLPWAVDGQSLSGPARTSTERRLSPVPLDEYEVDDRGEVVLDGVQDFRGAAACRVPMPGAASSPSSVPGEYGSLVGEDDACDPCSGCRRPWSPPRTGRGSW